MSAISIRLGQLRVARRLTQQQLAERMGTSHSAISRVESGQHRTSVATLERLAQALEVIRDGLRDRLSRSSRSRARCSLARCGGAGRTRADENGAHRRRPPLAATLRGRHAIGVELACDLAEALAFGVLVADACDYLGR